MPIDPSDPDDDVLSFLAERHLATLSVTREGRPPHVSPVGVTYDPASCCARVITWSGAVKARLVADAGDAGLAVSVCSVDGARWLTIEGTARATTDPERVRVAVDRYAARYRTPSDRPDRVALEIEVTKIMGRV